MNITRTFQLCLITLVVAFATAAFAPAAFASHNGPDLVTTIAAPSGVSVYQSGQWVVTVANRGNRDASNVTLTIGLPRTANSPTPYLMGTLGTVNGCTRSGFTLVCQLGQIRKSRSSSVNFNITLPYSTNPIVFTADAPLANDRNPSDNSTSATAALATVAAAVNVGGLYRFQHCTGTAALSSFIECTPGSVSSFDATLDGGPTTGTLNVVGHPGAVGAWAVSGTRFDLTVSDGSSTGTLVAQGVDTTCWEGKMTFSNSSQYVAIYRICPL